MKNVLTILAGAAVFFLGLMAAGALTPQINEQREDLNLMISDEVYDLPADMAVSQAALGTFRGVAINFLWQRAETLKNEGKFHEAIQLGELITRLQPRFPQVWTFVSWNQAYNISVATHTPEERWTWVKSGIDILQNKGKGIDANPNSLPLYWQLGWIYFHKIGGFLDNESWYYKTQVADQWHTILGQPPLEREPYLEWLRPVVDAPTKQEDLPPGAQRLARWLQENDHTLDASIMVDFVLPTRLVPAEVPEGQSPSDVQPLGTEPISTQSDAAGAQPSPEAQPMMLVPRLEWPEEIDGQAVETEHVDDLLAFIQKRVITGPKVNMDPGVMYRYAERYGAIDWRSPAAHAIYWSQLGLERIGADEGRQLQNMVNTRRNVLNGLVYLASSGQVIYQPATEASDSYISYLPAWGFWLSYDDYFFDMLAEFSEETGEVIDLTGEGVEQQLGPGYRNHMDSAITQAFMYGGVGTAEALYERMGERYAGTQFAERYTIPLSEFAQNTLQETLENPESARATVVGLLTQSLTQRFLHQNRREAQRQYVRAEEVYTTYQERNADPNAPLRKEMPETLMELQVDAIAQFISGSAGPVGKVFVPIDLRSSIYVSLDREIQQYIYTGPYSEVLQQQAMEAGYNPNQLFPPPGSVKLRDRAITRDQLFERLDEEKDEDLDRTETEKK